MATVEEIDNFVLDIYPKASNTLIAKRISYLNDIHNDVFIELSKYKKNPVINVTPVENKYAVTLSNINSIVKDEIYLSKDEGFLYGVTNVHDTDIKVKFADNGQFFYDDNYYYNISGNDIILLKNGEFPSSEDLAEYPYLKYLQYASPNELTETSDIPNLDTKYHNLLKYKLIQRIASKGDNPDDDVANYWESEYQELMRAIKDDSTIDIINNPVTKISSVHDVYGGWG